MASDSDHKAIACEVPAGVDEHAFHILRASQAHQSLVRSLKDEVASLRSTLGKLQSANQLPQGCSSTSDFCINDGANDIVEHFFRDIGDDDAKPSLVKSVTIASTYASNSDDLIGIPQFANGLDSPPFVVVEPTSVRDAKASIDTLALPHDLSRPSIHSEKSAGDKAKPSMEMESAPHEEKDSIAISVLDRGSSGNSGDLANMQVNQSEMGDWRPKQIMQRPAANMQMKQNALGRQVKDCVEKDEGSKPFDIMRHTLPSQDRKKMLMQRWECIIGFLILANAFFLGWHIEAKATHYHVSEEMVRTVTISFTVVFSVDLALRIIVQGTRFLVGTDRLLNLFDSVVIVSMILDVVGTNSELPQIASLRIVRILRLLRIVRMVRVFSNFREFRLMLWSASKACRAMLWVSCLAFMLLCMAGMFLTDACLSHCYNRNDDELACKYFGSLGSSMLTLYEAVLGGLLWGEVLEALSPVDAVAKIMFVLFVSLCALLFLNISAAVIFDVVQRVKSDDLEAMISDEIRQQQKYIRLMRDIFKEIDVNNSGAISLDEFQIACADERMEGLLIAMRLPVNDVVSLFDLQDVDNTGSLDIEEFILGCQRLRGDATATDVCSLQRDLRLILEYVSEMRQPLMQLMPKSATTQKYRDARPEAHLSNACQRISVSSVDTSRSNVSAQGASRRSFSTGSFSGGIYGTSSCIKKTEERAMLLNELREVCQVIHRKCLSETWKDPVTGESLEPQCVNLYHFSDYVICPQTVPNYIKLLGLQPGNICAGDTVTQVDSWIRAEGVALEDSNDGSVTIAVVRGRFQSRDVCPTGEILLGHVEQGVPEKVVAAGAISYKELVSNAPKKPLWYCSHWWGERIFDFVKCCEEHASQRRIEVEKASYWVCGYANRQYDLNAELGADLASTSFLKAISVSEGVLLVLDQEATPFERIWCDFEIYQSLQADSKKMLDIVTVTEHEGRLGGIPSMLSDGPLPNESARQKTQRESTFPLSILTKGIQVKLENGRATVEKDRMIILSYITKGSQDPEALQRANYSLNSVFARAAWPQAVKKNSVRDFDASQPGRLSLPQVMVQDVDLKSCIMSLEHMEEVIDSEVISLAEGLPPNLRELSLSFEGCFRITDLGVIKLAQAMPRNLQILKLDFLGCCQISNDGLEELARALPRALKSICVHFDKCPLVGIRGIRAFADHLPRTVLFQGTFKGTGVDRNYSSMAELKRQGSKEKFVR